VSAGRDIYAPNVSVAWVRALEAMLAIPGHAAVHFSVRIADSGEGEVSGIRVIADKLLELGNLQRIKSIRSTIFPDVWARRLPEPVDLARHYREQYPTLRRFPKNKRGTYFGRLVAYPMGRAENEEPFDQLTDLVNKLRNESRVSKGATRARKLSSRYEVNIWMPGDLPTGMAFPCMAHMSFHLVGGRLHLVAHYRNQFLIERAYGNYLGLAQLQRYVSDAVELRPGELMVLAGHASLDTHGKLNVSAIRSAVEEARSHMPLEAGEDLE
jgi:Thymidylate synthase